MVQKSRIRLFLVGLCLIAALAITRFVPYFWGPAILLVVMGVYLIVWATLGKGRWCRTCKTFRVAPHDAVAGPSVQSPRRP